MESFCVFVCVFVLFVWPELAEVFTVDSTLRCHTFLPQMIIKKEVLRFSKNILVFLKCFWGGFFFANKLLIMFRESQFGGVTQSVMT